MKREPFGKLRFFLLLTAFRSDNFVFVSSERKVSVAKFAFFVFFPLLLRSDDESREKLSSENLITRTKAEAKCAKNSNRSDERKVLQDFCRCFLPPSSCSFVFDRNGCEELRWVDWTGTKVRQAIATHFLFPHFVCFRDSVNWAAYMCTMRDDATWQTKRYEEKEENSEKPFLRNENFREVSS